MPKRKCTSGIVHKDNLYYRCMYVQNAINIRMSLCKGLKKRICSRKEIIEISIISHIIGVFVVFTNDVTELYLWSAIHRFKSKYTCIYIYILYMCLPAFQTSDPCLGHIDCVFT